MVLTDPPYFLDGLDNKWEKGIGGPKKGRQTVGGMPGGMKFDPKQGRELQKFIASIADDLFRVMVPGAFALVFSSPRLYHRMAVAFDDAGFEIRDQCIWRFTKNSQFKAFSLNHFVEKSKESEEVKTAIIESMKDRKTPQLRPQFESILCAQKPREGTFVNNWIKYGVGLIDVTQTLDGLLPSNVMTVEKEQRQSFNTHLTTKPVRICEHLINLYTKPDQVVLDPFLGSGTTCVAAHKTGRRCIGIDVNPDYIDIAKKRLSTQGCLP